MKTNILLTQSFGRESEYRRAIFTVLSAFCFCSDPIKDLKVVLFTDNPSFFKKWLKDLNVHFVLLTPQKIKKMRGSIDFIHRMKIALIEETFELFPNSKIFYIDSDTFFTDDPILGFNQVNETTASMHFLEYQYKEVKDLALPAGQTFRDFYHTIKNYKYHSLLGPTFNFSGESESWNAGVMIFAPQHKEIIADVYKLTHSFYPQTQNHASEQYAFSLMLKNTYNLIPCEKLVYHYWYRIKKEIIDEVLAEKSFTSLASKNLETKLPEILKMVEKMPDIFDNHIKMYLDHANQNFHTNKYLLGYKWYIKSLLKNPKRSLHFAKDVIYHTKSIFNVNKKK